MREIKFILSFFFIITAVFPVYGGGGQEPAERPGEEAEGYFVEWLGVGANVTLLHSFLYDQDDTDTVIDEGTGEVMPASEQPYASDEDIRYVMVYGVEISINPIPALGIGIGAETANNQLAPDSTYQKPFFNRYTSIYLDLRLNFAGLVSQLTSSEE